jgi:hypothetical protein
MWVKGEPGATMVRNYSAQAVYVNGAPGTTVLPIGEWILVHYLAIAGVPFPNDITFSGDIRIGKFAIYDRLLSATEIASIYANYTGVDKLKQDGTGNVTMSEPATPAVIYAHDWEITAS